MRHEAQASRIPDLLAGNISRWQKWRLNRHLRSCAQCQGELQRYQRIHDALAEAVPAYLAENGPSDEFMERIHRTIAAHPGPARARKSPRIARLAVPAATAALAMIAIVMALTLTGGNGASALSLATPVRGTVSITQGGAPVADGEFAYVSPQRWERSMTRHRAPQSVRHVTEISLNGENFARRADEPWRRIGGTPANWQPIPGLGLLALTESLFDAVLDLYQLEETGEREFRGQRLTELTGLDTDYAVRMRDSILASGGPGQEAAALFDFYTASPPEVTVLADDEERIRAIFINVPLIDTPDPMLIEVVINEFNADVQITPPLP
ncbi:MAG: hypothetical protein WD208_07360 [Dehalococcoidia bacterium]